MRGRKTGMSNLKSIFRGAFTGVAVGAANGLFGGGGGMIAVPLLSGVMGYEEKAAHATAARSARCFLTEYPFLR